MTIERQPRPARAAARQRAHALPGCRRRGAGRPRTSEITRHGRPAPQGRAAAESLVTGQRDHHAGRAGRAVRRRPTSDVALVRQAAADAGVAGRVGRRRVPAGAARPARRRRSRRCSAPPSSGSSRPTRPPGSRCRTATAGRAVGPCRARRRGHRRARPRRPAADPGAASGAPQRHAAATSYTPARARRGLRVPCRDHRSRPDARHHRARRRLRPGRPRHLLLRPRRHGADGDARSASTARRTSRAATRRAPTARCCSTSRWPAPSRRAPTCVVYFAPNTDQGFLDAVSHSGAGRPDPDRDEHQLGAERGRVDRPGPYRHGRRLRRRRGPGRHRHGGRRR